MAAERAEVILNRMQELFESGNLDVKPDTICFSSVINAWARSRHRAAPQRAEAILNRMQELFESGNHDVKPNTICFNSVINAWAKSGSSGPTGGRNDSQSDARDF
jgi:chorismate mutase